MERIISGLLLFFLLPGLSEVSGQWQSLGDSVQLRSLYSTANEVFNSDVFDQLTGYRKPDSTTIDSLRFHPGRKLIQIYADKALACAPFRDSSIAWLKARFSQALLPQWRGYAFQIFTGGQDLRTLVPNQFREKGHKPDGDRLVARMKRRGAPLVRHLSSPQWDQGVLYNINIALWHSHGWYYEPELDRWEWQRARIFQTVEDLYPMAYTLQMLVPMLEHAGAQVFMPRERDWQQHEVLVDAQGSTGESRFVSASSAIEHQAGSGFGIGQPPYDRENPFKLGSSLHLPASRHASDSLQWIPDIPARGYYAVYVSYPARKDNVDDAAYTVRHVGGESRFLVNQQMAGGTWVYLGHFLFEAGCNPQHGAVLLSNQSDKRRGELAADAVRFGGGMGNIAREGLVSRRPRYQEAARYYLQYAGFPDTLVWKLSDPAVDYNDDFRSRGEWVNYLIGAPSGPEADPDAEGLRIPIDLAFAFHTDAGISGSDTTIGTLGIYSTNYREGPYPSGLSRMASRDLTDIVQSQIVSDIRAVYDPNWTRRGMWNKAYSEAFRPNVPTMLLELLSHQNGIDIRFGHEPEFRFLVSRAIYKGMLSFLHGLYGLPYIVQPLPVSHFRSSIGRDGAIELRWNPVLDPLEETAVPESYMVYTRVNNGSFDHGRAVDEPFFRLTDYHPDSLYSFRVTALNRGGEGFPSEVLSVYNPVSARAKVLIVNAFDRTSAPAWFEDEKHAGFLSFVDEGVPWVCDLHTVGAQYEFRKDLPWTDDDAPGHGASYADLEPEVIPGNTFDFSVIHGRSLAEAACAFATVSDEALADGLVDAAPYELIDYLAGEERSSYMPGDSLPRFEVFGEGMLERLSDYLKGGGNLLISGAHIGTDVHHLGQDSAVAALLKYHWRTSNASRKGKVHFSDQRVSGGPDLSFNTALHPAIYGAEGADAIEPAVEGARSFMRYTENNMNAGVAWKGDYAVVALGFPLECVADEGERKLIIEKCLAYLLKRNDDD